MITLGGNEFARICWSASKIESAVHSDTLRSHDANIMNSSVANGDSSHKSLGADDKPITKLSCPFTWGMESILEDRKKSELSRQGCLQLLYDYGDDFPEYLLIYLLMLAYESTMGNDPSISMQYVVNAEKQFALIEEKNTLKNEENILRHILMGTKYCVLLKMEQLTVANELLEGIYDIDYTCNTELGMLEGCQCMAWSLYYSTYIPKAISCIQKALEYDSGNAKWHYLLGTSYRRLRRKIVSITERPSPEEASAFQTAYKISKKPLFTVSLAQMYKESNNFVDANQIYKEAYALNPSCCTVRLKIALGFIRGNSYRLAKECLDYVRQKMPNHPMYAHYMGLYEDKCNQDYQAALPYYEAATRGNTFGAEWQFVKCKRIVHLEWDPLPYMMGLLKKYDKNPDDIIQCINIEIGLYYLLSLNDIPSACQYLTKAIEIRSDARMLTNYSSLFHKGKLNIYHILKSKIQLALQKEHAIYDENKIVLLRYTLDLCSKNGTDLTPMQVQTTQRTANIKPASTRHRYYKN